MKTVYFDKDIPRILATKFAAKHAKGLLYGSLNAVKYLKDLPETPLPAGDWVRVKNIACGLCGTDISFFKATTGTNSAFEPIPGSKRTYLGHENVGVITEVGKDVTEFKVGDRVTIRAYMAGCDTKGLKDRCEYCKRGDYNFCTNYGTASPYGDIVTGAGWSDSFIYPAKGLAKVYDEITDEQAVMVEPTCVSVKTKQEFALKLGADHILNGDPYKATAEATGGSEIYTGMKGNKYFFGGFDRIYDCIGGDWSNHTAVRLLKARGTLVKIGHHMRAITFDESPIWWQELTLVGVDAHGMEHWQGRDLYTFDLVQEWIRDGIYKLDGFVTHHFKLDDYKEALKLALENPPDVVKIVLDCE